MRTRTIKYLVLIFDISFFIVPISLKIRRCSHVPSTIFLASFCGNTYLLYKISPSSLWRFPALFIFPNSFVAVPISQDGFQFRRGIIFRKQLLLCRIINSPSDRLQRTKLFPHIKKNNIFRANTRLYQEIYKLNEIIIDKTAELLTRRQKSALLSTFNHHICLC